VTDAERAKSVASLRPLDGWRAVIAAVPAKTWRRAFWLAVAAGVIVSMWPVAEDARPWFRYEDKAHHALAFAVLAVLGWLGRFPSMPRLALGLIALGAAIELAQGLTFTRTAEWADLLADTVGVMVGMAVVAWARRRSGRLPGKDRGQAVVD
jgi:peptidoglycan/LPS O-acetylase OafA/YrhL